MNDLSFCQQSPVLDTGHPLYSHDRVAHVILAGLVRALGDTYGLDEAQAIELLQSKWLRHACDRWGDEEMRVRYICADLLRLAPPVSEYLEEAP